MKKIRKQVILCLLVTAVFALPISAVEKEVSKTVLTFENSNNALCIMQPTVEWQKTFGGNEFEWFYCIRQTNDGGFIATGTTEESDMHYGWLVKVDANGNEENLNGDQRDSTNKNIRDYLGTYEDFVLTALSLQNNNTGFIDKTQRERKDLLSQFLDIEIFEQQYLIGHEDIKETAALIREYKKKDLSKDLSDAELDSETYQKISDKISKDKADHNEMRRNLNEIIITLSQQLYEIHDLENPEDIKEKIRSIDLELEHNDKQITEYSGFISEANEKLKDIDAQLSKIDKSNLPQLINLHEQRRI